MRSVQKLGTVHAEYALRAQRTASARAGMSVHERAELGTGMPNVQRLDAGSAPAERERFVSGGVSAH